MLLALLMCACVYAPLRTFFFPLACPVWASLEQTCVCVDAIAVHAAGVSAPICSLSLSLSLARPLTHRHRHTHAHTQTLSRAYPHSPCIVDITHSHNQFPTRADGSDGTTRRVSPALPVESVPGRECSPRVCPEKHGTMCAPHGRPAALSASEGPHLTCCCAEGVSRFLLGCLTALELMGCLCVSRSSCCTRVPPLPC